MCANRLCFYVPESFKNTSGEKGVEVTKAKGPRRTGSIPVVGHGGRAAGLAAGICERPLF